MEKSYNPKEIEKKWQEYWEDKKTFDFDPKSEKPVYSIDTPPPTVSGRMHIGHAFSYIQGDIIARFRKITGYNLFYPFGTDDNGLPTERLVEKTKKIRSLDMTREDFIELADKTIKELKPEFVQDWKNIGVCANFKQSYSTIDEHCIKTSQYSFIDLFNKELVEQKESPISWCPHCQTAIAQAEFENIEKKSFFIDIAFKQGEKELIISTTRPELLPSCVALFANPQDKRYKDLIGKNAEVPLFNYEVPILADENVDMGLGTGLMMCCTFGDKEDIEKWAKYSLPLRISFTKDGKMNELAAQYQGIKIDEARKKITEDLQEKGFLKNQKEIMHNTNVHDKCGTPIEFMKTKQWFIKILDNKKMLIKTADEIKWYPEFMKKRYIHWVENLNWEWCISRQRHFGVPFPLWKCKKCGKTKLAEKSQLPVDPIKDKPTAKCECGSEEFEPEMDVMDTWATSSLTPQIALNWFENSEEYKKNFPETVRMQAHDIIRTWAFYTIVKAKYHENKIPWKEIMIAGHVLDPKGQKMSKSKGNIIEPVKVLEKYSADALRYWASCSKLGEDMPYMEKDLETGKKLMNKLWNAAKFVIMHLEKYDGKKPEKIEAADKWILSKLSKTIKNAKNAFEKYESGEAKREIEKLFWQDFCDNYLELVKDRLYNPDKRGENAKNSALHTLETTFLEIIKMLSPIIPHITEEIFHNYYSEKLKSDSINQTEWNMNMPVDEEAKKSGDLVSEIISCVRKYKSEKQMSIAKEISKITIELKDGKTIAGFEEDLKAVTKANELILGKADNIYFENDLFKIGIEE